MEPKPRTVLVYERPDGSQPYIEWLSCIQDIRARATITTRLNRVALGLLGDHHDLGNGVWELRIDYGPGYRIYYGEWHGYVVLLLMGGTKRGQQRDIKTAKEYFENFKQRNAIR
jgi:putative addiction module killer protein